ncbi:putative adenylyltransferase/sulfurtransferase MoeZ [Pseudoruegeria aquimaris]|uniref:Molybdopterin-synthase adenylyltransferase n=1 Tax=Pseudoruegeria aquimaris TaxID=393663 RepID=A0A1Y5SPM6_9RHOB|nr:molybdopterin-synthase adenylyltransferase MoeB [Pseudoruegeria aquimaris]SLN45414.1 putative adenylyltransferase/sulfurtransferase MoeZ [Pseudoruegeria aquimaris]
MGNILFVMAVIWIAGHFMGAPRRLRLALIAVIYLAMIAIHLTLPADAPLRMNTGGSVANWLILGGAAALVFAYRALLIRLRGRHDGRQAEAEAAAEAGAGPFSDTELERYARHIVLRELGGPGQKRLKDARVLVIGAGGLGSPALLYLAAAGVGTIGVIDADVVDNSNLQRQVIHTDGRIGAAKVFSAEAAMRAQNPHIVVKPYNRRLTEEIAQDLFAEYDLVLDGTDNFATRYLVNATCVALGKPLISGALTQWEGQISLFDPALGAPCYQCVFPEAPAPELAPSCAAAGVLGPLPGVIGTMMAVEAVKEIARAGEGLRGRLMIYDALYAETRSISVSKRADCPCCGQR